jgi:macrolide-specific efflux system membrane fusion protein
VVLVVLLGGAGTFWAVTQNGGQEGPRTFTREAEAQRTELKETVAVDGTLAPARKAELSFLVSGTVSKVRVAVGDTVKKNAKLADVTDTDLKNALSLAEADLDSANASYTEVKSSGTSAAKKSALAQVESAKAARAAAKDNLKNAVLRAPFAGTVGEVNISKGDTVGQSGQEQTGYGILLLSPDEWLLTGTVAAADVAKLEVGQPASVTIGSSQEPVTGTVSEVGIVASGTEDGQATFPVTVKLDEKATGLYSGTTAAASVTVGSTGEVVAVPTQALVFQDGGTYLKLASTGELTPVEVGSSVGELTEVTSGVAEGEKLLIEITFAAGSDADGGGIFMGGIGGGGMGGGRAGRVTRQTSSDGSETVTVTEGNAPAPPQGGNFGGGAPQMGR